MHLQPMFFKCVLIKTQKFCSRSLTNHSILTAANLSKSFNRFHFPTVHILLKHLKTVSLVSKYLTYGLETVNPHFQESVQIASLVIWGNYTLS